jgi:DNA-binding PadR family transcriptional regulator
MTRLVILGLLCRQPLSGYQIQRLLQLSRTDQWAEILPGSIYHALKKLTADGLVQLQATERTGFRTKAIYAITAAGREEFRKLLREAWRTPHRTLPATLYAALNFVDDLPQSEVQTAIAEQISALEAELASWNAGEAAKEQAMGGLPPFLRAAFANGREHMEADLRFLRHLHQILPTLPETQWPIPTFEEEE